MARLSHCVREDAARSGQSGAGACFRNILNSLAVDWLQGCRHNVADGEHASGVAASRLGQVGSGGGGMLQIVLGRRALCSIPAAAALSVILLAASAWAASGDLLKVTAERANLRAGPSDRTEVSGQVQRGDELIELRRQGDWFGIRSVRTGEEGWIYGNLVQLSSATQLCSRNRASWVQGPFARFRQPHSKHRTALWLPIDRARRDCRQQDIASDPNT